MFDQKLFRPINISTKEHSLNKSFLLNFPEEMIVQQQNFRKKIQKTFHSNCFRENDFALIKTFRAKDISTDKCFDQKNILSKIFVLNFPKELIV